MSKEFQLLTTKEYDGVLLDCYRETEQENAENAFWATREQIGRLLGYKHPRKAIKDIHLRNKERLDMFSKTVELPKLFNGAQIEPPFRNEPFATVYNFKGLLEICRYSQQPKANAVIDKLWEIADEIRQTGIYVTSKAMARLEREVLELRAKVEEMYPINVLGNTVLAQKGAISFKDGATFLSQHGIEIGQNRLFRYCREQKLLCSRKGNQWNKPTQKAVDKGLFNLEISGGFKPVVMITPKGLQYLSNQFMKEEYPLLCLMMPDEYGEGETQD